MHLYQEGDVLPGVCLTQPSIPPGSVNEYHQLRLRRQKQVWFIPRVGFTYGKSYCRRIFNENFITDRTHLWTRMSTPNSGSYPDAECGHGLRVRTGFVSAEVCASSAEVVTESSLLSVKRARKVKLYLPSELSVQRRWRLVGGIALHSSGSRLWSTTETSKKLYTGVATRKK